LTELAGAYDLRARLSEITVPTLVVAGVHERVYPAIGGPTLAPGIPHATLCPARRRTLRLRRGSRRASTKRWWGCCPCGQGC